MSDSDVVSDVAELHATIKRLDAEILRLRAALAPFAKLARGIPDNWPGQCPLRIDSANYREGRRNYEWIAYHGIDDNGKPLDYEHVLLPTIAEWRAVEEVLR